MSYEHLKRISKNAKVSLLHVELLRWHERLNNLSFRFMFQLFKAGVLTKKFLQLQNVTTQCTSFYFGTTNKRQSKAKGKLFHVNKVSCDCPRAKVCADQLKSK